MKLSNISDVAKLNSRLNTFILSADVGRKRNKSSLELCTKKEFADKAEKRKKD